LKAQPSDLADNPMTDLPSPPEPPVRDGENPDWKDEERILTENPLLNLNAQDPLSTKKSILAFTGVENFT
jgi:hypothetical protein